MFAANRLSLLAPQPGECLGRQIFLAGVGCF